MRIFDRHQELLEWIESRGHCIATFGHAPDGAPIVSVKAGGQKEPAILISAGSHSFEQAGVGAAVALIDELQTAHQVYVMPNRDPMGINGYGYVLSLSLGDEPPLPPLEGLGAFLKDRGELLYEQDDVVLVLIGEYGYSTVGLYGRFAAGASFLEPLKGRRIYFPSRYEPHEDAGPYQRAYTLIVTPDGEVLHINRFHDTAWAPIESRCIRNLMAEINPGLTMDLHECGGEAFWFSARHQRDAGDEAWEERMADAMIQAVRQAGQPLEPELPGTFFEKRQDGAFWLVAKQRGEGLNLADFGAARYGPAFTIETTTKRPYDDRVQTSMLAVQTAVRVFEERYR